MAPPGAEGDRVLQRLAHWASLGAYLGRRLVIDPVVAPARAAALRGRLAALRAAEAQEGWIPVRGLLELCPAPGRVVVELGPLTDGNPTPHELFCLGAIARASGARHIFEIGTFDGTTTLQLALNSAEDAVIWTLDLPAEAVERTRYPVIPQERAYILKPASGIRFQATKAGAKIRQLLGDSARFEYGPYLGRMDLVVVDGSHALPYVRSDSANALALARPGGWIVWHDYGIWPDVTTGLHELVPRLPLCRLEGTTLVVGRAPA
jgi:hypothetical protein